MRVTQKRWAPSLPYPRRFAIANLEASNPPKFQGQLSKVQKLINKFDFLEVGKTALRHSQLLYVCLILARDIAAIKRGSLNEVREHTLRDILGASSWFYLTPMIYPIFLKWGIGKDYRQALVNTPRPSIEGTGLWATLRRWNQKFNPLFRWEIPTAEQLKERMVYSLQHVEKTMGGRNTPAYQETKVFFENLLQRRSYASALGIAFTILFLGIGIPLINIFTTRKNVLGDSKHPSAPQPQSVPTPPIVFQKPLPQTLPRITLPYQAPVNLTPFQPYQPAGNGWNLPNRPAH